MLTCNHVTVVTTNLHTFGHIRKRGSRGRRISPHSEALKISGVYRGYSGYNGYIKKKKKKYIYI